MGKLDISLLRYITSEDVRVLTAIEMGMKNHEIVPFPLIVIISKVRGGNCYKILGNLCKNKLIRYQKDSKSEGYYLTYKGYDYLAIKTLVKQGHISHFGNQIGVGKESDVYIVTNEEGQRLALKIHRLGRNSFRRLREKRDYFKHRSSVSWLYLSRLAATKEYDFMKALYSRRFPVPQPIAHNRHCVVMQLLMDFIPLSQILDETSTNKLFESSNTTPLNTTNNAIENAENFVDYNVEFNAWKKSLFNGLLETLIAFTRCGLIHGDYNEFNIMVKPPPVVITTTNDNHEKMAINNVGKSSFENSAAEFYIIDFPQIISIHHPNAKEYFDRDVNGIVTFFARRLHLFHTGNSEQSDLDLIPLPNFEQLYREILNPPSLVQSDTNEISVNDTTDLDKYYCNDTDLRNGSENEFEHSAGKLSDSYGETDCDNSSCHSFNPELDQDTTFQTNNFNPKSNIIIDPVFDLSSKVSKILLLSSNQNTGNDPSSPNKPQTENIESKHDDMERILQAKYRMAIRGKDRICIEPTSYSQLRQQIMCNDPSNPLTDQDIRVENVQKLIKENQLLNSAKVSKTFTTPANNKNKEKMAKTAKKQGIRSYKKTQRMCLQKETLRDSQIY